MLHLLVAGLILSGAVSLFAIAGSDSPPTQAAAHQHTHTPPAGQPAAAQSPAAPPASPRQDEGPVRSVLDFTGPSDEIPDVSYDLTAGTAPGGAAIGGQPVLTYNGTAPGPVLRARAGQLVEVVLHNRDVSTGVTIHWHGLDVPNAEDGVAGVTQDAVQPGQQHTYRFRPTQVGTFWYHSHQDAAATVARGLYGAIIIDPPLPDDPAEVAAAPAVDVPLVAHTWTGVPGSIGAESAGAPAEQITVGTATDISRQPVPVGRTARLRLINTDNLPQTWIVTGSAFRVVAIDGTSVVAPTDLLNIPLRLAGGGRYDIELTMPAGPVEVRLAELNRPGVLLVADDGHPDAATPLETGEVAGAPFDPLGYGTPTPTASPQAAGPFDQQVELNLETKHGRRNGLPFVYWTINGQTAPDIPAITVAQGDLVRVHIVNNGTDVHPMHLHGHHLLVLSRDGVPASGSPWWTDTLGVEPGEDYVLAFRANNPGIWMDHCHNLLHAAAGMMMQLGYAGVHSPFTMDHGNLGE